MQHFCHLLERVLILLSFSCELSVVIGAASFPAEHKVRIDVQWPAVSSTKKFEDEEYEDLLIMTTADKSQYRCTLPSLHGNDEAQSVDSYTGPTPLQLLKPMFSKLLCYFRLETYWSYELCHGHYFRQFHEETTTRGRAVQEYFLGMYDALRSPVQPENNSLKDYSSYTKGLPTVRVDDAELPYLAINMSDGTFCALRGKPRFTRVLYVCHPRGNNGIYSFKETSTCEYEVIVLTTALCKHPAFRIDYFTESVVNCYPMPGSPPMPKVYQETSSADTLKEPGDEAKSKETDPAEPSKPKEPSIKPKPKETSTKSPKPEDTKTVPPKSEEPNTEHFKPEESSVKPKPQQRRIMPKVLKQPVVVPHDKKLMDDVLSGDYCLHGGSGWWRYEFCYGKFVHQYHEDSSGEKTYILLGQWNVDKHLKWIEKNPSKKIKEGIKPKYVSHFYSDGDFCDEIRKYRELEVRLKCKEVPGHPDSVTLYFSEPHTCQYIITVESPIFCPFIHMADENGLTPNIKK